MRRSIATPSRRVDDAGMSRVTTGAPEPLGVTLDEAGANVSVFSAHAEAIYLCLFDEADRESERIELSRSGDALHAHVRGLSEGQRYGFRAYGPDAPGHRFNGAKLLVDPYALALDRPLKLHSSLFAYGEAADADSAPFMAKSVMTRVAAAPVIRPRTPWRKGQSKKKKKNKNKKAKKRNKNI
jgi:glycogen operon protein